MRLHPFVSSWLCPSEKCHERRTHPRHRSPQRPGGGRRGAQGLGGGVAVGRLHLGQRRADERRDLLIALVLEVKEGEEKLAEMQDKYLRLSAEFDNYRKRTLREKIELSKYAGENLLLSFLPIMDDFERALKHMDSTTDCIALKDGIDIMYVKFSDFLKQNGIKEIESLNSNFNVDLHDAVAKVPVEEADKKGKVVDVVLKGYYLQDKVLRHSKVIVGE